MNLALVWLVFYYCCLNVLFWIAFWFIEIFFFHFYSFALSFTLSLCLVFCLSIKSLCRLMTPLIWLPSGPTCDHQALISFSYKQSRSIVMFELRRRLYIHVNVFVVLAAAYMNWVIQTFQFGCAFILSRMTHQRMGNQCWNHSTCICCAHVLCTWLSCRKLKMKREHFISFWSMFDLWDAIYSMGLLNTSFSLHGNRPEKKLTIYWSNNKEIVNNFLW